MSDIVIRCENLGKKYRIGTSRHGRYVALRDVLAERFRGWGRRLLGRGGGEANSPSEEIWALKDVSFEVRRGECVGIIGRNGAGKSTLLKLLSRITEPTEGRIRLRGRVASLLEVGTGFHPELTGRENIYLNGAILGMKRTEIRRKFDEIVAFAEVEKFIDTPVKHFSSGMYMRLAFAVAAHLEPEILIVDEVLAVGDTAFQKKCLGKMGEVASEGRTVLFVSHNMAAIAHLCGRCACLHLGHVVQIGKVQETIDRYFKLADESNQGGDHIKRRLGSGEVRFIRVEVERECYRPDEAKTVRFRLANSSHQTQRVYFSTLVFNEEGAIIAHCDSRFNGIEVDMGSTIEGTFVLKSPWLKPGDYTLDFFACSVAMGIFDRYERACAFRVLPLLPYAYTATEEAISQGVVLADFDWNIVTQ